jgi:hypothetical protein
VPDSHRVIAAQIQPTLMAQEVIGLSFVLVLRSKLLGVDMNIGVLFYKRADLVDVCHYLILHFDSYSIIISLINGLI